MSPLTPRPHVSKLFATLRKYQTVVHIQILLLPLEWAKRVKNYIIYFSSTCYSVKLINTHYVALQLHLKAKLYFTFFLALRTWYFNQ